MARNLPDKGLRRAAFLRALGEGETVAAAAERSRLKWSTLYAWRRDEAAFRAAWDAAVTQGADALAARFDEALVRRAIDGIDEPVFHAGEAVGTRRRYSDPLLMFGIRDLRERQRAATAPFVARTPRVTVVIRQFGESTLSLSSPGEDPAIQGSASRMDARVKPEHDKENGRTPALEKENDDGA